MAKSTAATASKGAPKVLSNPLAPYTGFSTIQGLKKILGR